MFGTHFYNEGLRRLTIAFGQIFNDIIVQTKDANDSVVKRLKVPLAYAPKEKFIVRLHNNQIYKTNNFLLYYLVWVFKLQICNMTQVEN